MATPNLKAEELLSFPEPKMPNPAEMKQLDFEVANQGPTEPIYASPDDELYFELKQWLEEGRDRTDKWREEAEEAFDMVAGWQWDAGDIQALAEDNRPTITFNRIGRNIDLINGMEVQGREEVAYLPREESDSGVAEVLSAGVQYVTDETDAADEKSDAFRDLCVCGMGWTNTVMDYRDFEQGMPVESRIDPLVMYWDPHATKRNISDSKWRARAKIMSMAEAVRMFPRADLSMLNASWMGISDDPSQPSEPSRQSYSYEDSPQIGRPPLLDRVTIIEIQWWEEHEYALVEDKFTAQRVEMPMPRAQMAMQAAPGRYEAVMVPRKVFFRAFLGGQILSKQKLEKLKDFTFQPMTGKRDRRTGWYGMVRAMMDPQKWANKWLSQSMHILNTGAKNTVLYERGAVMDGRQAQRAWTQPGGWVELNKGAIANNQVQVQNPTQLPPELSNLMSFAMQSIQDCVGVNQEQLGMTGGTDANRAALLEHERRKAGITLMAHFFDSKRLFVKRQGRLVLKFMVNFMNDGRMLRITNEGQHKYVKMLIQNPDTAQYDIIVDQSPDSPSQVDKTWATLIPMMPMLERLQPPPEIWAQVIRYSPLPSVMKDKMAELIEQGGQGQEEDPEAQAKAGKLQADAQKSMAEIEKIKAQIQEIFSQVKLNHAKIYETTARVEMDALEGVRETQALDDARELGKMSAHENA